MSPLPHRALHDGFRIALDTPTCHAVIEQPDMQADDLGSEAHAASARAQVVTEREVVRRFNLYAG